MEKITCVIIDDEPGNIITLSELLKEYCPEVVISGTASDPVKGLPLIKKIKPKLLFLDIEMPFGNAFDLLDKLGSVNFEVIFVTAFNHYAVRAFKYAALDYILKPVNIMDLKNAVLKAEEKLKVKSENTRISLLLENLKPENMSTPKIALPVSGGLIFEEINNITHLTAEGSYTVVFVKGKKKQVISKNLKEYEDILPKEKFCRIHHSHIININCVKKYYAGHGSYVEMDDGTTIEVSVRKKGDFLEKFNR